MNQLVVSIAPQNFISFQEKKRKRHKISKKKAVFYSNVIFAVAQKEKGMKGTFSLFLVRTTVHLGEMKRRKEQTGRKLISQTFISLVSSSLEGRKRQTLSFVSVSSFVCVLQ